MATQFVVPMPPWLAIIIIGVVLWLGATLSINSVEELLVLGLVWVVCPASGHYYYMFLRKKRPLTSQARQEALSFLNDHAPGDVPKEQRVTVFDLV